MKIKTLLVSSVLASTVMLTNIAAAALPGAYVGVGAGASTLRTPDQFAFNGSTVTRQRGGLGGRLFAGYNFNKYFGLEAGFASYARSKYTGQTGGSTSSISYTSNAFDVVGKGYLPLGESGFNLYGLAGVARFNETVNYQNGGIPLTGAVATPNRVGKTTYHKLRPVYGVGVAYDFNNHITTNLEFTRIVGSGNMKTSASATPNADLLTLNVSYNFG